LGLTTAVGNLTTTVGIIKDDILKPLALDVREARDGVTKLTGWNRDMSRRIENIESIETPEYECRYEDEILASTNSITAHEMRISGLVGWRRWIAASAIPIAFIAMGFGGAAYRNEGESESDRQELRRDVERHEQRLDSFNTNQIASRRAIIDEVRAVPRKVRDTIPEQNLNQALHKEPLTSDERARIQRILDRAEKRNGNGHEKGGTQ